MALMFDEFYRDLEAYYVDSFPKRCSNCGRVFATAASFIAETEAIRGTSGLKSGADDLGQVVELFRNCTCGSTLMDVFADRRDDSEAGLARRRHFAELQAILIGRGLSRDEARQELVLFFRGEPSRVTELVGDSGRG
ncbi:MAG: hypothetical protein BWY87_00930 [Deltaproteobacteria bacterium ADurb.Bin510]|nr:MAG: hypothetical protein BWY87_00930 [Deltaproteobacteria bacterium ADurb.Bin510]